MEPNRDNACGCLQRESSDPPWPGYENLAPLPKKYVHDEVIRAWLDGADVQVKVPATGEWCDMPTVHDHDHLPQFAADGEYRVRPNDWVGDIQLVSRGDESCCSTSSCSP